RVFDEKVESLGYDSAVHVLEITLKNGQSWQLFDVPPGIYAELNNATIYAFLRSIAHRFRSAPVKTGTRAIVVPVSEKCLKCNAAMQERHRAGSDFDKLLRVLWHCASCGASEWKRYGAGLDRERRSNWH